MSIEQLEPPIVWRHFARLCAIPRPSKHEARVRDALRDWAVTRGLTAEVDAVGNLLLRKPASAGCESAPTLAMQAHLDMVCQAASGDSFDFLHAPIVPRRDGEWLCADNTTLGADNGIGVALALAALEDDDLRHGPLEVLLTVDEEAGMGGAHGLAGGWLRARHMLNLDTEAWGEFYLGCAGGCDVNVTLDLPTRETPADAVPFSLTVGGLRGGHSGCDIHLRRGNANRLLAEALAEIAARVGDQLHLISLHGGTARNALPREAVARLTLPAAQVDAARSALADLLHRWRRELVSEHGEKEVTLELTAAAPARRAIAPAAARELIAALLRAPYGVAAWSADFPGVVDSSNNLGIVTLADGHFSANLMVRSLRDEATRQLAGRIAEIFSGSGATVAIDGHYPGWTPNPTSPLLARCQAVYRQEFGGESAVRVIHAGLECGLIGARYPGLDIVSFGPTIEGAHAPGERVDIAAVARCWQLLRAIVEDLAAG